MLSFKQFIILEQELLENRIQTLKTRVFKDGFDTSHDRLAQHRDTSDIVDHFANNADPTKKKTHTQWILNQYKKGNIRQEDHPRIKEALSNFETHKGKLENKDINKYTSLSDVEDAVGPYLGTTTKRQQKKAIKSEGADLVHNDEERGVTVHHIKTEQAACSYGAGTKWCTAGKKDNMFNHYNEDGPMFVIQHGGRKYQFHNKSKQFMDEKDNDVKFKDLHPDIQKSLAKSEHPEIQVANLMHKNPHFEINDENVNKLVNHKNPSVRVEVAKHPEHAGKLVNDGHPSVRREVARHPEHAGKLVNDENSSVREAVAQHPEHAGKLVNDEDRYVLREVAKHPEHAGKLVNDGHPSVRREVARHPEHAGKLVNDKHPDVRANVARHPEHAGKLVDDEDRYVRVKVARHPEHAGKLVNDKHPDVREAVARHPEHAGKLVNDGHPSVVRTIAYHPEHADKLVNHEDSLVREIASETLRQHGRLG